MAKESEIENLDSKAPYIIICNGRIGVQTAYRRNEVELAVIRVSETAAALVTFYELAGYKVPDFTIKSISDQQHWLMDNSSDPRVPEIIAAMFNCFDDLEKTAKK